MVKKYPKERPNSTHVGLRIPNDLYKEMCAYRKQSKISLSRVIVAALNNYMGLIHAVRKQ